MLALEKTGSFSLAAEQCFVTQSTLSTMIKKLEDQIDLKIFNRRSKPIALTQEGLVLIDQLKIIYHEYENLKELVQDAKEEFYGTFRIGIIPTIAPFLIPLFLDKVVKNYPNVNFSIDEITTAEIESRILKRDLDIGILSLPITNKEFTQTSLYLEDFLVYDVSKQTKQKTKYRIKDIDPSRLWLLEEGHCMTNQIEKICHLRKQRKLSNNLVYNSGSILSLLELVNMNRGVTLLPRLATKRKNLIDKKYMHNLEVPIPVREVGIITHSNFAKKRILNMLVQEIRTAVSPHLLSAKKVKVIKPF